MAEKQKQDYDDEHVSVVANPQSPDCYDVWIGKRVGRGVEGEREIHFYLQRGILSELVNASPRELLSKLELINPVAAAYLNASNVGSFNVLRALRYVAFEEAERREFAANVMEEERGADEVGV